MAWRPSCSPPAVLRGVSAQVCFEFYAVTSFVPKKAGIASHQPRGSPLWPLRHGRRRRGRQLRCPARHRPPRRWMRRSRCVRPGSNQGSHAAEMRKHHRSSVDTKRGAGSCAAVQKVLRDASAPCKCLEGDGRNNTVFGLVVVKYLTPGTQVCYHGIELYHQSVPA
eukprot:6177296-Pleurochrysis_carterae.AAC.3